MLLSEQLKAANKLFKAVDYDRAIPAYSALLETCQAHTEGRSAVPLVPEESQEDANKTYLSALLNRCSCYCQHNDWELGLADALKATEIAPHDPRVPIRTAVAYEGLRQYQQVLDVCTRGLEQCPNDTSLLNLLARSEAALGLKRSRVSESSLWSPSIKGPYHLTNHGHTHGHDHTHDNTHAHDHGHGHEHEHNHDHAHEHNHAHDHSHSHNHEHVYSSWLVQQAKPTPSKRSEGFDCITCKTGCSMM